MMLKDKDNVCTVFLLADLHTFLSDKFLKFLCDIVLTKSLAVCVHTQEHSSEKKKNLNNVRGFSFKWKLL